MKKLKITFIAEYDKDSDLEEYVNEFKDQYANPEQTYFAFEGNLAHALKQTVLEPSAELDEEFITVEIIK